MFSQHLTTTFFSGSPSGERRATRCPTGSHALELDLGPVQCFYQRQALFRKPSGPAGERRGRSARIRGQGGPHNSLADVSKFRFGLVAHFGFTRSLDLFWAIHSGSETKGTIEEEMRKLTDPERNRWAVSKSDLSGFTIPGYYFHGQLAPLAMALNLCKAITLVHVAWMLGL